MGVIREQGGKVSSKETGLLWGGQGLASCGREAFKEGRVLRFRAIHGAIVCGAFAL